MNFRLPRGKKGPKKNTIIALLGLALVAYALWETSGFVLAFRQIKHAHVAPTDVSAVGWSNADNAYTRDLSPQAPYVSFSNGNSANLFIAAFSKSSGGGNVKNTPDQQNTTPAPATQNPDTSVPASTTPDTTAPAQNNSASTTSPTDSAAPAVVFPVVQPLAPDTTNTAPDTSGTTPAPAPADSTAPSSLRESSSVIAANLKTYASYFLSQLVTVAFATTTNGSDSTSSTTPLDQGTNSVPQAKPALDVSTCSVLGTPCHTIEFGGFNVGGSMTDKEFQKAELNFSFANLTGAAQNGGRLTVHYYHNGQWKSAGELDLSQSLSNQTNGGYFTETLDGITSWSDMSDVKVAFEYEVGDGSAPVQLYLDAVWIDAVFVDQVQDLLSGNIADPTDAPPNVSFDVTPPSQSPGMLIYDNGNTLPFPYLDALDDTLGVRLDRAAYTAAGSSSVVYTSITNTGKNPDSFKLFASFPGGKGVVSDVSQYLRNVPVGTTTPQVSDVSYFCQGGWQQASTTGQSTCPATGESYVCKSLNAAGDNCVVNNVVVGASTSTTYVSDWVPVALDPSPGSDKKIEKNMPPGYAVSAASVKSFDILPGQTLYFKVTLSTPDSDSRRFVLTARGQSYFGDVDSLRLRNEVSFTAVTKVKKVAPPKDNINDQLSENSDFSVDQLPSFHFKFKTQRGFFTRLRDYLFGKNVGYKVASAQLRHSSGEVEHLPINIDYGQNDEWTLQLNKQPRSFRPGKYAIDISMNEGGSVYTDTVPFYWGVLAMNTDKSSYSPGDTAHLSIAALDDKGDTMCNAQLSLTVTDPAGNSSDVPVVSGGGCGQNNVTSLPDFVADYGVGAAGTYTAVLSRLDDSGNIVTSSTESFTSAVGTSYLVTRDGPTRIFPASAYDMHITVSTLEGFNGQIIETLPEGFTVSNTHGGVISRADGVIYLTWDVSLNGTEVKNLSYTLKAPEVSPYIYLLGPLQFKDSTGVVFKEPNTWKIASDATQIATGVAWLTGNTTTAGGTNISSTTAAALAWNLTDDYDTTYFSHSTTTNNSQLTVNVAGDYLVAITVPQQRADTNATRTDIEADIRVDGGKKNIGVSRAFIRTTGGVSQTSNHVYVLLKGLNAGDYIESYVHNVTTATDPVTITSQASMYAEYIGADQSVYFGLATTTTSGTNFNATAVSKLAWFDDPSLGRSDSLYTHNNASASTSITLASAGPYMVFVNIPLEGAVTSANVEGQILLNGVQVTGGEFKQGYISNSSGGIDSSMQFSGIVNATTTNEKLSVTVFGIGNAGTVTIGNDTASIYVQQVPATGVYFGTATTTSSGTSWNPTTAANVLWGSDSIKDTGTYTHSTASNSHQITVTQAGDYLLTLNDSHAGNVNGSNQVTSVSVNGTAKGGAETKTHFIANNASGQQTSGSLVYLLRNLAVNDVVTVTTVLDGGTGTITEDFPALLSLWHKSAQSNFIQDTERWYANVNAEPPTDPWPSGPVDLNEGDSITTGNATKSGDVLRLRMALKANVTTVVGADSFKLQYAPGTSCSLALAWADVGAVGSSTIWRGYDNAAVTAGATLSSTTLSVSSTTETYEEQNPSASTPNAVTAGKDGEWDWTLQDNGAANGTSYCFRMVQSSGQVLKDYNDYPLLVTNNTPDAPALVSPFDNAKTASTSPALDFSTSDDNGEDLHYEVQISTDPAFGSTVVDDDSITNFSKFTDVDNPSDKAPFASGDQIEYIPTASLTNGTTYWWRVRSKDPSGSNTYGSYSSAQSFTVDTSVTISTWFQTTQAQFNEDTLTTVVTTGTNDVQLTTVGSGTLYSPLIDFASHTTGNSWGAVSWHNTQSAGNTITYHVEYFDSTGSWSLIPDTDLANNSVGTTTGPINIAGLDPSTYEFIRVRADFVKTTTTPVLSDWTVNWALSVSQPTLSAPFDNEEVPTTTPTFAFTTTDPQSDNLQYQVQWSTDANFITGVSSSTSGGAGWSDVSSTTASSPYPSGDTINYKIQAALASSTTYWWRVRARDPSGGNSYSIWSSPQSFTTDTTVAQSTWFQTTNDQFNNDTEVLTGASGGDVTATSTTGNVAIFRAATANETVGTTLFTNGWDTTVRRDGVYTLSGTTSLQLQKGHYAVMYGLQFVSSGGTARSEIQSNLNLAGVAIPIGWSQGLVRRNLGSNEAFTSGGGIINVANNNDSLIVQSMRTDNNTGTVLRFANSSGLQLVKLDDAWSYLRLSKTSKQVGPVSTTWLPVSYNSTDEIDSSVYGFSNGGTTVTLKSAGHYLVFANTFGSLVTGSTISSVVDQRLTLNGTAVPGSFSTVFMNGSTNGSYQGAASIGIIIQATTSNSTLNVQLARSVGTAAWTIDGSPSGAFQNRTGLTIVKLPEADFIRVTQSTNDDMNPAALTARNWNTELEKDTSFTHSTSTNTNRITASVAGDYLLFGDLYAAPGTVASAEPFQGWRKNGGTLLQYGQSGGFVNTAASDVGNWSGVIFPSAASSDFFEMVAQAFGSTTTAIPATQKGLEGVRIASLTEADTNANTLQSPDINFSNGNGPKWSTFSWSDTQSGLATILYQVLYFNTASSTYDLVPDSAIPGNSVGTTTSPINISNLNHTTYNILRTQATFNCAAGVCPTLHDWTVKWSQGINISGTAKAFDQTTNVTSGTVDVAVNGVLQSGKTGTISGGTWTISNVTAFTGDVITVFVNGASTSTRAVAVTKYTSSGDITGMALYQNHLTLGSADNPTITNADLNQFDDGNAASSGHTGEVFDDVTGSNLNVCNFTTCTTARLLVLSGTTYEPGVAGGSNVTTPNIQIDGTFIPDSNTVTVSGSWKNNSVFIKGTSTVIFTATSTSETIDSTLATTSNAFNVVTFGQTSGNATWTLLSPINASSTLSINFGTLQNGTKTLSLGGNLTIGSSGVFARGTGSTTFSGTGTSVWTDSTALKQDMGTVIVGGTSKTVQLGSAVKATTVTINSGSTLDATASNFGITVNGNWTNNGTFAAQAGTVTFAATSTGFTITPGSSNFYNLTFNGVGGNWSFTTPTISANNFTIATGTVTLPTGTTTVNGNFDASAGTFLHNNGVVLFGGTGTDTIRPGTSSFFDLVFNGASTWSFPDANATTSRNVFLTTGSVTLPSGTFVVGGAFTTTGGSFTNNSGTIKFTSSSAQNITFNGSSAGSLLFAGSNTFTFTETNITANGTTTFQSGTTTLPSGTFTEGGSFVVTGGAFTHNSGTVRFTSSATGRLVTPGNSSFFNLTFDNPSGGWTVTTNATSTNNTSITNAAAFVLSPNTTLSVGGTFTNSVGGSATTFASSTLFLNSGTSYTLNTKTTGADVYGTLSIGASTNIRMWGSSAATTTVSATGSLYSMNHAGVSGALNIYGAYTRSSGSDFWDYATDFDGTALGGSSRAVSVNIASSSSLTFSGGLLDIVGTTTATTTVQSQGSGAYSWSITGGSFNAQYYQIGSTTQAGLSLSGTTTVSTLSNGSFVLSISGGSSLTIASTVIDRNQLLQIQQVKFATTTGVTTGFNVTETGAPTSTLNFWWFRNHYGNLAGESFDSDPGPNSGNPGYIHWDDSGYNITVSGNVYSDHGNTAIGAPCDGVTPVVAVAINATLVASSSCSASTGAYSISGVQFNGDVVLTTYLNNASKKAVAVTKTPTANITDMNLYQNAVIVRHEGVTPIGIVDLAAYDSSKDSDITFAASTSTNTYVEQPGNELYIWSGKTFIPGGNITLQSGGNGDYRDGTLFIATSSVFTAAGTQSHAIGGSLIVQSGATLTAANSIFTFTATTTGKSIFSAGPLSLYSITFNGSGGQWLLGSAPSTAVLTVQNLLTLTAGTLGGTGDITVQTGDVTGGGTIAMTGGTFTVTSNGNFGNSNSWQFNNLTFGSGALSNTTTKTGSATTTVTGVLTVAASQTLNAGSSVWVLSGSGTPFVINGTFNAQTAPFTYSGTSATNVTNANYAALTLAPSAAGSPTYTLGGGTPTFGSLTIGNGTNPVTVTADTNDPSIAITNDVRINNSATFVASNIGALTVAGNWTNAGTFTNSGSAVTFNAGTTGKTINPGASAFYDLIINNAAGGWTITNNATTTHDFTLTNAAAFVLSPNTTLSVGGTFTNSVGGSATTFASSTLFLNSGTSYTLNTKSTGADVYGTLSIGASTNIRMWGSSAATTTVSATGSLYSMNHAGVSGALNIYGAYTRSSGSDFWDYATDFDGTNISGSPRKVNVSIASSSSVSISGGLLDIIGGTTASTTVANQGTGAYSLSVSGGTLFAQYFELRNMDGSGLNLSGTPTISSLSNGDFLLAQNGGSMVTVAGSVIDANALKTFKQDKFATSSGISSGFNVTEVGTPGSSWKFDLAYGNFGLTTGGASGGEAYDNDPGGDPGFIRWSDSAGQITISGRVYSDEGATPSGASVCGVANAIKLNVEGTGHVYTTTCTVGTGAYSISGISFNPGDTLTLYIDGVAGHKAANVSVDPISNISGMDLYENRVIVRHEDTVPITINDIAQFDSNNDSDIPFRAVATTSTKTMTLPPNTKLIVWDAKTFAPAGNLTIQSGATSSWDGSLEVRPGGSLSAAGTQSYSIGGNFALDLGATFSAANSTVTFTATTTGKTITAPFSSFYNLTFNGAGGNWAFASSSATTTNDFTITQGSVTLPTNILYVGGSFLNTGGSFAHNNGTLFLTSTAAGKSIRVGTSTLFSLTANGSGGSWSFFDANATTSGSVTIASSSTLTLPSGTLAVGASFVNSGGTFTHNSGTVKFTAFTTGKSIQAGGSDFNTLLFNGVGGAWTFLDTNATSSDFTITNGTTTLPTGTMAINGSFVNAGGFTSNFGTVKFVAGTTGKTITPGTSSFYNLAFDNPSGGWTVTTNATSTNNTSITNAAAFVLSPNTTLSVGGTFTNSVGGSATTFASSTLFLNSGTSYTLNTKTTGADVYGTLSIGASTNIRMWGSSAATTTVSATGSLYSMNHAGVSGALNIYGAYTRSSGSDFWDYATDFDGTALGGSSRAVTVNIASSSSLTFSGGLLDIVGIATASTTIQNQGSGAYAWSVTGGTLNAQYFAVRNMNGTGLAFSGTPTINSLSSGDFQLAQNGGALITVAGGVIDANASARYTADKFALAGGVTTGFDVVLTGSTANAWTFGQAYGNLSGEAFDTDGVDACGQIRWDDSSCLFVNQTHYRWRNDDGGEGALASAWFNASWTARKKVAISNPNASSLTSYPVKLTVTYDSSMNSDFSDLRFTDSSGTTSLSYFIESKVSSVSAVVWVNVPSLPALGSATIYMYYGNAAASDASSGSGTFSFYESFESNNLTAYSGTDKTLFTTSGSFARIGSYGLNPSTGNTGVETTNGGIYRTGALVTQGKTIRYFQYVDASSGGGLGADEPCTLFGVQAAKQNYGVCLEEFNPAGGPFVALSKNVQSNDLHNTATVLATTSITYSTGWYEVSIDWLTTNAINVSVYNSSGVLQASLSTTDSSYTSGGMGFTYWGQHGGWDYYTARPYAASAPTAIFGTTQGNNGATWAAAEDTTYPTLGIGSNTRLRFSVANTGSPLVSQLFRLQVAPKGAALNCESVPSVNYSDVPVAGSCGSSAACMASSAQFTNLASTSPSLTYLPSMNFAAGEMMQNTTNQTNGIPVPTNTATEVEYNFQMTANATGNQYCFRTSKGGAALDSYDHVAEATVLHAPAISNISFNGGSDISLTEGSTTPAAVSCTITDLNGYADVISATSTVYRSGVSGGAACTDNQNNCYQLASTSCSYSSCSGNSCTLTCTAPLQYFADPTDTGSAFAAQNWLSSIAVQDTTGLRDTQTSFGVDVLTLFGLSLNTASINFGSLANGQNTGTTNATTTVINTGNSVINIQLYGSDLSAGASSIAVGQQKFSTTTFAYGSCALCQVLTGPSSPTNVVIDIPKQTTSATSTGNVYWGINIPNGTAATSYTGSNTFVATGP